MVIEVREYKGLLNGEFVVYYDDSMAPVSSVSRDLLELLRLRLSGADIKEVPVNKHASFPQFLFPGTLVIFSILIGLELIPSTLLEERAAFSRLRLYSSVPVNLVVKLLFAQLLMGMQVVLVVIVYRIMGVKVGINVPGVLVLFLLTLCFSLLGMGMTFIFRLEKRSKSFLQIITGILILLSGLLYPVGFFPEELQRVATLLPSYYGGVLLRAFLLRSLRASVLSDYIAHLGLFTIVFAAFVFLLYRGVGEWDMR